MSVWVGFNVSGVAWNGEGFFVVVVVMMIMMMEVGRTFERAKNTIIAAFRAEEELGIVGAS